MKKIFTLLCATALTAAAMQAKVVYVATDGNDANDGLSWDKAVATIQAGFNKASEGDQVWVAGGTYSYSNASPVTNSSYINWDGGIDLYGSFKKGDTSIEARERPDATGKPYEFSNPTVLTSNGVILDNRLINRGPKNTLNSSPCVIDGITIENYGQRNWAMAHLGAHATFRNNIVRNTSGLVETSQFVGIYAEGDGTFESCLFEGNHCAQGGYEHKYFVSRIQQAAATNQPGNVRSCIYRNNTDGYCLQAYYYATGGAGTTFIEDCTFQNNNSGCISLSNSCIIAPIIVNNCLFEGNKHSVNDEATVYGITISGTSVSPSAVMNCTIRNNENTAPLRDELTNACIVALNSGTVEFIDNLVYNNKSNNYSVFTVGSVLNNTFVNNIGTATMKSGSSAMYLNNLYVDNEGTNGKKGFYADQESGIYFYYNGVSADQYTIASPNAEIEEMIEGLDKSIFVNATSSAGIISAQEAASADFSLVEGSRAINAGEAEYVEAFVGYVNDDEYNQDIINLFKNDIAGNTRIVNDKINLGCYQGPKPSGVDNVIVDNDENAPVEYYNLQGVRVANPANGLYIKRQGRKTVKVIL